MSPKTRYILYCSLGSAVSYALAGFIIAIIINMQSNHPHSMVEILYFLLPAIFSITGLTIGFLTSFFMFRNENNYKSFIIKTLVEIVIFSGITLYYYFINN